MKKAGIFIGLIGSMVILFGLELTLGSISIPFGQVVNILFGKGSDNHSWSVIVLESRLPRSVAAICCGAFLSVSGLMMQTLFRNPLAGPHILGVSSGASLGVAIVVMGATLLGLSAGFLNNRLLIMTAAFLGAMLVLAAIFLASIRLRDNLTVLILGVLLGAVSMAVVGILQYLSPESQLKAFLIWTLGSFDGVDRSDLLYLVGIGFSLLLLVFFLVKPLNLLLAGEEYAQTIGLNIRLTSLQVLLISGALTAITTAYCGPIGFIGVVVPHFSRMLFNTFDHRTLFFACVLIGINVMLVGDLLSHMPGSDLILPVNSITALIGIPFIFWMLVNRKFIAPS